MRIPGMWFASKDKMKPGGYIVEMSIVDSNGKEITGHSEIIDPDKMTRDNFLWLLGWVATWTAQRATYSKLIPHRCDLCNSPRENVPCTEDDCLKYAGFNSKEKGQSVQSSADNIKEILEGRV